MDTIPSFLVDHNNLKRGIYVSRVDDVGNSHVTSFDVRVKAPNKEPVLDVPAMHTIEHLGATFLRNHAEWKDEIVYFGPMGCRTGYYLLVKGNRSSEEIHPLVTELFEYMASYDGEVPGAAARDCGNYLSHDLAMTRWESEKFLTEILKNISEENLNYPE